MSKFCVFLCFLCATTFDKRTKEHNASRSLRLCVKTNIYIFDIRTKVHIAPRPLRENKICSYVLMSKIQRSKFCAILCIPCATIFLTEEHIFLTQSRKVSQSLRGLREVISHRIHGRHRKPCGALWSHADGADFRRSMRSKILCISVLSVCNDF